MESVKASLVRVITSSGDYVGIPLTGRIIKIDDSKANKWQAISRQRLLSQEEVNEWIRLAKLGG